MSEPAEFPYEIVERDGEPAVVIPFAEYRHLREVHREEMRLDYERMEQEEAEAIEDYLARKAAGTLEFVSQEEARRRLGL